MIIEIGKEIFQKFPGTKLGILVAQGIDNSGDDERIEKEKREAELQARQKLELQALVDHPTIAAWRQAYQLFGSNPKTFKNSPEALLRRILKGEPLPRINKIVDLYNLICVTHIISAGGDDIDKVDGDIHLGFAKGGEPFTVLGGTNTDPPEPGEVIYRDAKEVTCRRWNWRQCDKTKITSMSRNVCLVIEALGITTIEDVAAALSDLKAHIQQYCGGTISCQIIDEENNKAVIR